MHNVIFLTFPKQTSLQTINKNVTDYVKSHGDRCGTDRVDILSTAPFDTKDEAVKYIGRHDKGWYGGYAVTFYDHSRVKNPKKIDELEQKIKDMNLKKEDYINAHSVKAFKASFIGCSKCNSKINKEYLNNDKCPVCKADLRTKSTLERIASFDKRIKDYTEKIKQEKIKQKSRAEIKWLVKFEYHS